MDRRQRAVGTDGWVPPWVAEVADGAAQLLSDPTAASDVVAAVQADARARGAQVGEAAVAGRPVPVVDGYIIDIVTVDDDGIPPVRPVRSRAVR